MMENAQRDVCASRWALEDHDSHKVVYGQLFSAQRALNLPLQAAE